MNEPVMLVYKKNEAILIGESGYIQYWRHPSQEWNWLGDVPFQPLEIFRTMLRKSGWVPALLTEETRDRVVVLLAAHIFNFASAEDLIAHPSWVSDLDDIPF